MRMATRSKTINGIKILLAYLRHHWLISMVALYFGVGMLLEIFFGIDLLVPCLWDTFLHFRCPGCGLTTACMYLITMDWASAFRENPLIFVVLPAGLYFIIRDFLQFNRLKIPKEKP